VRKILFWVHLSAGLAAGAVVAVMAVTGIALSFEPRIVAWAEKGVRAVTPPPGARRISADALVALAQAARPEAKVTGVTLKSDPAASAFVGFGREGGLYVNPYTGEILGKGSRAHDFMHAVEDIHRWLGSRERGKPVTGAATMALFFLVLSGLSLWWPRAWSWEKAKSITVLNPRLSGKARDFQWHHVIGFWGAPFFLVTTLTGLVMSYTWMNNLLFRMTGNAPPAAQGNAPSGGGGAPLPPPEGLDRFFTAAATRSPGWVSAGLRFPAKPEAPVTVSIQEPPSVSRHPNPRSQLSLDPATGAVLKWESFAEQNAGKKLRAWVKPIHTGEAGGWVGQGIAALSATGLLFMVWTGWALAWRRFRSRRKAPLVAQEGSAVSKPLAPAGKAEA